MAKISRKGGVGIGNFRKAIAALALGMGVGLAASGQGTGSGPYSWNCTATDVAAAGNSVTCFRDQYGANCAWSDINDQGYSMDYNVFLRGHPQCADPHGDGDVSSSSSTGTVEPSIQTNSSTATQPSIDSAVQSSNQTAIQQIQATAGTAQVGDGQTSLLKSAGEVNQIGANQAATVAALYCADAANKFAGDPEAAGADYAKCGQYFSAAKALNGNGAGYKSDGSILAGDAAKSTLDGFEKNFGVSGSDYLGHMLGADGGRDALAGVLGDKIPADKLAAMAGADAAGSSGTNAFVVDLAKGAKKPGTNLREALKAKLAKKEAGAERAPAGAFAARVTQKGPENQFDGLSPLREGILAASGEEAKELTLFDVVHDKYAELRQRWAESRKLR